LHTLCGVLVTRPIALETRPDTLSQHGLGGAGGLQFILELGDQVVHHIRVSS
jgi:hypothetical protein